MIGLQVIEHYHISRSESGTDGAGESQIASLILFLLDGIQHHGFGQSGKVHLILLLIQRTTYIGGKQQNRILEGNLLRRIVVRQNSSVQDLKEQEDNVHMCLLDLIEEDHTSGMLGHKGSNCTGLCTGVLLLISGKHTVGIIVTVFTHIKSGKRKPQKFGGCLCQIRLTHSGRSRKQEHCAGFFLLFLGTEYL